MSSFNLATMTRRLRNPRRKSIPLRPIVPPATMATDLYRACYLPVIQAIEAAVPAVMAEYERTLSEITTDAPADVDARLDFMQSELRRLLLVLTPRLRDWALRVENFHRGKWRGAVLSATGIDLSTMIGPEGGRQSVEEAIAWNTSLIRDVGDQARQRIANSVFSGIRQRKPAREVAAEIREAVAMSRRRSIGIASDQLTKLSAALDTERMREAGIDDWKWRHSGKLHYRPEHLARNGKEYSFAEPPPEMPGELPYCGCRKQAVVRFD